MCIQIHAQFLKKLLEQVAINTEGSALIVYRTCPPPQAQGSLWEKEWKESKNQRQKTQETVSSGHNWAAAL